MNYAKRKRYEKSQNFRNSFFEMPIETLMESLGSEKSKVVLYSLRALLKKTNLSNHDNLFSAIAFVAEHGSTANNRKLALRVVKKHFAERLEEIDIAGKVLSGHVYFIFNPHSGFTKIGMTTNLIKRVTYLQKQWTVELELLNSIKTHKLNRLEGKFHHFYKQYRLGNEYRDSSFNAEYAHCPISVEWFDLPALEIENIRNGLFPIEVS